MAHQMAMASKVLKSDIETALCSRQPRIDGNDTGPTARVTEGISHWLGRAKDKTGAVAGAIATGTSVAALPVLSTDAFVLPTAVQLTEAMLGDAMQKAYINGASPTLWVVPPGPKRTVSRRSSDVSTTQVLGR